jgi:hypothetical protein
LAKGEGVEIDQADHWCRHGRLRWLCLLRVGVGGCQYRRLLIGQRVKLVKAGQWDTVFIRVVRYQPAMMTPVIYVCAIVYGGGGRAGRGAHLLLGQMVKKWNVSQGR